MQEIRTKLGQSGRIVVPTEYRKKSGLKSGDAFIMYPDKVGLYQSTVVDLGLTSTINVTRRLDRRSTRRFVSGQ